MTQYAGNPVHFVGSPAVHVDGNPVTFQALAAVHVEGNPVVFRAPKVWFMRAAADGLVPIQMARGAAGGEIETLSPDV